MHEKIGKKRKTHSYTIFAKLNGRKVGAAAPIGRGWGLEGLLYCYLCYNNKNNKKKAYFSRILDVTLTFGNCVVDVLQCNGFWCPPLAGRAGWCLVTCNRCN